MLQLFEWLGYPPSLNDQEDELKCNIAGGFSTKSCYNWLIDQQQQQQPLIPPPPPPPYQCIWVKFVSPKTQTFMWLAAQNAIPTTDNLVRRGVPIQNMMCSLCNSQAETVNHLLLHCSYTHKIWNYFIGGYNVRWANGGSLEAQLQAWKFRRGRNRGMKIWPLLIFAIVRSIWEERNRRVMANKSPRSEGVIINEIKALIFHWGKAEKWFWGYSFRDLVTHWKVLIDRI